MMKFQRDRKGAKESLRGGVFGEGLSVWEKEVGGVMVKQTTGLKGLNS